MDGENIRRDLFTRSSQASAADRLRGALRKPPPRPGAVEPDKADAAALPDRLDYLAIKGSLQERLLDELGERNLFGLREADVTRSIEEFTARVLEAENIPLNEAERRRLSEELVEETIGLGPLAPLMADPAITDILVNGPDKVYVERFGRLEKTAVRFRDQEQITRVIERIAAATGRRIDTSSPMADLRLGDGSRVNATLPPVTIDGPTISIRRFGRRRLRRTDLLQLGMMSQAMMEFLTIAIERRANLLISGGTGAGKSTLLGALAEAVPGHERIVTIEDTAELRLDQEHVVRMETRIANVEGRGRIAAKELVINALRMRPDRIMVGEVRGAEALDMLQAMNTGHDGSMTTIHANSARDALARLETMVLMAGIDLPSRAIREQIASAFHLLVHVRRGEDGIRRVESIGELAGLESNTHLIQEIFAFRRSGRQGRQVIGEYEAMGIVPRLVMNLREQGYEIPLTMFQKGQGSKQGDNGPR
ncbi:MAG: CpaF family protein [Bryobacteraceae bacterium]